MTPFEVRRERLREVFLMIDRMGKYGAPPKATQNGNDAQEVERVPARDLIF